MYEKLEYENLNLKNEKKFSELKNFLISFNLKIDLIDYSIVVRKNNKIIATISKYANLMKCIAVSDDYKGLGLSKTLINKMILKIKSENYSSSFLITKVENYSKFNESGLYQIYRNDKIIFFTDNLNEYENYKTYLKEFKSNNSSAIVMNANPFTNGHDFLVEQASLNSNKVFLIVVKEDISFFTYKERLEMIKNGVAKYHNVEVIEGSDLLISKTTFPSYFLNEKDEIVREQAKLDIGLFFDIYCKNLNINKRFVGDEPLSRTTNIYNEIMKENLEAKNVEVVIIPRKEINSEPISASKVRNAILKHDTDVIMKMCPKVNWNFLTSEEVFNRAKNNIDKIVKNN